jgi:hypothetical protein
MRIGSPEVAGAEAWWGHLPVQIRKELEQYQQDQFLPKYRDECIRYYRSLTER